MLRFLPTVLVALVILMVSCEKENFDITEEIPEETNPVIVETEEEDVFFLKMPNGETVDLEGQGVIDENVVGLVTSSSSAISCEDGIISIAFDPTTPGFFTVFTLSPDADPFVLIGGGAMIEGFTDDFALIDGRCESMPSSLEVITLTEDRFEGIFTAEFFTSNGTSSGDCEDLISLGLIEVVFNVALVTCE